MNRTEFDQLLASNADLRGKDFSGLNLENVDLAGKDLSGANFSKSDLSGANLLQANFSGANLEKAIIVGGGTVFGRVNFTGANLKNAEITYGRLDADNFTDADLRKADFSFSKLHNINLRNAKIAGADFAFSELKGAICYGLTFNDVTLYRIEFDGAKFLDPNWLKNLNMDKYTTSWTRNQNTVMYLLRHFTMQPIGMNDDVTGKPIYMLSGAGDEDAFHQEYENEQDVDALIDELKQHIKEDQPEAYVETLEELQEKLEDIKNQIEDDEDYYADDEDEEIDVLANLGVTIPEWPGGLPEDLYQYESLKLHQAKYKFRLLPIHNEYYTMSLYDSDAPYIRKTMDSPAFSYKLCPPDTLLKYEVEDTVSKVYLPSGFSSTQPVIGKKIYEVLASLNIPTIQLLKSSVSINDVEYNDYWTLNVPTFIKCIDFKHSNALKDGYDSLVSDTEDPNDVEIIHLIVDPATLSEIPLEKRLIFRFEEAKSIAVFHKSIVDKIRAIKSINVDFTQLLNHYGNE